MSSKPSQHAGTPSNDVNLKPALIDWTNVSLSEHMRATLLAVDASSVHEKVSVYEGFGSFHSENVEDLIAMKESDYVAPRGLPHFAKRLLTAEELHTLAVARCRMECPAAPRSVRKRARDCEVDPNSPASGCPGAAGCFADTRSCAVTTATTNIITPSLSDSEGATADAPSGTSASGDSSGSHVDALVLSGNWNYEALLERLAAAPVARCDMGLEFRQQYFGITPDITFINHGAFGSCLVGSAAIKRWYEERMEREVVEFVDRELLPFIVHSIRSLSRFLKADPRQVILLQNATFALNCAMRLIEKDDVVAFLDTEYLSVYKMMWFRCQEVGASHHELSISRFLHDTDVMGDDAALTAEIIRQLPPGCTTMIIDCITSTSALHFPIFTHIVPALRRHGVTKIIVDGAHSPLQVELDFASLPPENQPTMFVGNLHKWFSSPKSVGFFWVRAEDADKVRSVVLSHGAGDGLLSEFIWDGTRDYGAYLSIPAIVDFWAAQDVARVRDYCGNLLVAACTMLTQAFASRPVARHAPFMSLVELPDGLQDSYVTGKYIQDVLHDVYAIEVPVKRVEGRYYLRISAFVYNTPSEYVFLKEVVLDIARRWARSEERLTAAATAAREATEDAQRHAQTSASADGEEKPPCDERIRREGGCGVSGLDPTLKRSKTRRF